MMTATGKDKMAIHYSSKTEMWETPQEFFDRYDAIFDFDLDVCALPENAKCARYFTPEQDGLKQQWGGVCWMNPPYGREIGKWVRKAFESSLQGATVVCLLPARTDTRWWHDYCTKGKIEFIKGRLKFINRTLPSYREDGDFKVSGAPFPNAVVIFYAKQGGKA